MRRRHAVSEAQPEAGMPAVAGTDLSVEFVLNNLAAGRTAEDLLSKYPDLSLVALGRAKNLAVQVALHDDHSTFRSSLRIRHLIAALQPHPVVDTICAAFEGVSLGRGPSLHQMEDMSNYGEDDSGQRLSDQKYTQLRAQDEINQWKALSLVDLDTYLAFAFADAESFRFYAPARIIYCLTNPCFHWEILNDLYPRESFKGAYDYQMQRYALLDNCQRHAIATFLWHVLGALPTNYGTLSKEVEFALEVFWLQYLDMPSRKE